MNMKELGSYKRKIKVEISKFFRKLRFGILSMREEKNAQDRLIVKIVRSLLDDKETRVVHSPNSNKTYIRTKDKKITVIFDIYTIRITNHKFFFTGTLKDGIGQDMTDLAKARIEREMNVIDQDVITNEKEFLLNVYDTFVSPKIEIETK